MNVCVYLRDVVDENHFHNCVHESEKAVLVPAGVPVMFSNQTIIVASCSRDYCEIRRTFNSTPGPSRDIPCILVRRTRAFQECGQILKKPHYTVYKVQLSKKSMQARFSSPAITCTGLHC